MDTSQKVLLFLKENRQASAAEMARALGMTRANIRYHLSSLREAGMVEIEPAVTPASRGRPIQVFRLTTSARPNNLVELADAVLSVLLPAGFAETQRERRLLGLAEMLATGFPSPVGGQAMQLNHAVQHLNERTYAAAWEARPAGPVMRLRNCPYALLISEHPELCRMDALLLERLTGLTVQQVAKIDLKSGSPPACVFLMKARKDLTGAQG